MVGKAAFVLGLGAGYVLGARAGRPRYEQIKAQAERLWNDPTVQQTAARAQELVKQQAPQVQEKVTATARRAAGTLTPDNGADPEPAAESSKAASWSPSPAGGQR